MNIYLQQVVALSLPNKYTKWYCDLINRAISRNATKDIARHHILPRSFKLGGEKDKINIAKLTNREHYICHKLLVRMVTGKFKSKMYYAVWRVANSKKTCISSREYELLRKEASIVIKNRIVSDETRKRQSISLTGKGVGWHHTNDAKKRIGDAFRGQPGRKWSDEEKAKRSEQYTGKNHPQYGTSYSDTRKANISASVKKSYHKIFVTCVHCKTVTTIGNYIKHHATFCKRSGI